VQQTMANEQILFFKSQIQWYRYWTKDEKYINHQTFYFWKIVCSKQWQMNKLDEPWV